MMPAAPDGNVVGQYLFEHQPLSYRVGRITQGQRIRPLRGAVQVFERFSQRDIAPRDVGVRRQ